MSSEKRSGSEQSCLQDEPVAKKAKKTFGIREHIGVVLSTAATITAAASIKARGDCYGDRFQFVRQVVFHVLPYVMHVIFPLTRFGDDMHTIHFDIHMIVRGDLLSSLHYLEFIKQDSRFGHCDGSWVVLVLGS